MRLYTGLLILGIPCYSYAQPDRLAVTICPLTAVDGFSFPTIQGGLEWRLGGHFSWYNEFGIEYIPSGIDGSDTVILRPHGIKLKSELRHYIAPSEYLAANFFLMSDVHNTEVDYSYNGNNAMQRADAFGVRKTVVGWNVLYGTEKQLGGRLWVDMYIGIGMRFRDIRTVGEQFNPSRDVLITSIDLNVPDIRAETDSKDGWSVLPNFTTSVRVMYRFGKMGEWDRRRRRRSVQKPNLIHPPQM